MLEEELIEKREMALLEKEGSGCRVLLANDMSEDLSRMFRLFSRVPDGLAPMADILKQHIAEVGRLFLLHFRSSQSETMSDKGTDAPLCLFICTSD